MSQKNAYHFVLVEDDHDVREVLNYYLSSLYPCQISAFDTVFSAAQHIKKQDQKPHLIFCENHLHQSSLQELANYLKANQLQIPVVKIANLGDDYDKQNELVIEKPFCKDEVIQTVNSAFNKTQNSHDYGVLPPTAQ